MGDVTDEPETPAVDEEGSDDDAFDPADHLVSWDNVDELAEKIAAIPDGDKDAAKALYRELAT